MPMPNYIFCHTRSNTKKFRPPHIQKVKSIILLYENFQTCLRNFQHICTFRQKIAFPNDAQLQHKNIYVNISSDDTYTIVEIILCKEVLSPYIGLLCAITLVLIQLTKHFAPTISIHRAALFYIAICNFYPYAYFKKNL